MSDEAKDQSTNPQAEADTQDTAEGATDAGTMGNPEQPTPEDQSVNPEDEANAAKADEQSRAQGDQTPQGQATTAPSDDQRQPTTESPTDEQMVAGSPTAKMTAQQQQAFVAQQQQQAQRQAEVSEQDHKMGLFRRAAEAIAGGAKTTYTYEDGKLVPHKQHLTGGQIAMGIVASILGGMGAGAQVGPRFNPGAAIGAGFAYGENRVKSADEQAKKEALDEHDRQVQNTFTNFKTAQNKFAIMKLGNDASTAAEALSAPLYQAVQKIDASGKLPSKIIKEEITGSDFKDRLAKDPQYGNNHVVIQIGHEFDIDQKTGEPYINQHGDPAINTRYAVLDPNAVVELPKGMLVDDSGKKINYPEGFRMRVQAVVENIAKQEDAVIGHHANLQLSGKEKDTTSERAKAVPQAGAPAKFNEIVPANKNVDQYITAAADKYGLDANLIRAVMNKESNGNPKATSPVGAQGLMQVMPYNQKRLGITDPFDPQQSINGGAQYLSELMKQYNGDISKVLSVYNGGKGALTNPKPETKKYVADITSKLGVSGTATLAAVEQTEAQKMPTGLDWKTPSDAAWNDLPQSARDAFKNLGGHWQDFISHGQEAVKAKRMSDGDFGRLADMLESADGKFRGQAAIDENKNIIARRTEALKKETDTRITEGAKRAFTDPEVQAAADALRQEGSLTTLKDIGGMAGGLRLRILTQAKKDAEAAGEKFDVGLINERVKYIGQYENPSGGAYKNRTAINNMIQHGADLVDINNEYRRTNVQVLNTPINAIRKQFGDATLVRYNNVLDVLKGEAKIFFAGGYAPTENQEKMWNNIISNNATPAQVEAFAKEITNLGFRRASTFDSEYKKVMGHGDPDMIIPEAREAAQKLAGNDAQGQMLKQNIDKFASGGEYGRPDVGYKPGQLPKGNGQKLDANNPAHANVFEQYMKAAGNDAQKAQDMMHKDGWVF
jgi:hypothetical protein